MSEGPSYALSIHRASLAGLPLKVSKLEKVRYISSMGCEKYIPPSIPKIVMLFERNIGDTQHLSTLSGNPESV